MANFNKFLFYLSVFVKKIEKKFNITLYFFFPFRFLTRILELYMFEKINENFNSISNYFLTNNLNTKKNIFVISAGVGKDIDFEKKLIENFDIKKIVMVDPTTYSKNMMKTSQLKKTFFFKRALDLKIGNTKIYKPYIEGDLNFSLEKGGLDERNYEFVKTTNIKALLRFLKYEKSSPLILKLDIEGVADIIILNCLSQNVFPDIINFELEKPINLSSQFNYFFRVIKLNKILKKKYKVYRNTKTKIGFRIELTAKKI